MKYYALINSKGAPSPPNLGNPKAFDCDPHPGMENLNFAYVG